MKTILKTGAVLVLTIFSFVACDSDNETVSPYSDIDFQNLPVDAQSFVTDNFDGLGVLSARKRDTAEADGTLYKVNLVNGYSIDFNISGDWITIWGKEHELPNSIFTEAPLLTIKEYITTNHGTDKIVAIQKKNSSEYQVDLFSGSQLTFDSNGSFVK